MGAEVADFERRRAAELALDVEQVLEHVRRLAIGHVAQHVDVLQAHQRRRHAAVVRRAAAAPERRVERQIRRQQHRVVAAASRQVARHVEPRVAGILHIEDAGAGAERPLLARVPGPAEPRREVLLVVENQPIAEPAVARHLNVRRETEHGVLVDVAAADAHQHRMAGQILHVRRRVVERDRRVHQRAVRVEPWRRVFVAQAEIERHVRADLPRVGEVIRLAQRAELRHRQRHRRFGLLRVAEQEVGEGVAGGDRLKLEIAARELVAHLVVHVVADAAANLERMPPANPRQVVAELERLVPVRIRPFGAVAEAAEAA